MATRTKAATPSAKRKPAGPRPKSTTSKTSPKAAKPRAAAPKRAAKAKPQKPQRSAEAQALLDLVLTTLDADKAEEIVALDLRGRSDVADDVIIASGRSQRHVGALADNLAKRLKDRGYGAPHVEGLPAGDWVLVDAGDIVVHLFRPEVRVFYNLEGLWADEPPRALTFG